MKRLANIGFLLLILLIAVQPSLVLHFCGQSFVDFYLHTETSQIQSKCTLQNETKLANKHSHQSLRSECPMRQLLVVEVEVDDHTFQADSKLPLNAPVVEFFVNTPLFVAFRSTTLFNNTLPPTSTVVASGRAILAQICTLII
ncbi:MAG: hypothetical protein ACRC9X_03175 [Bacteroidales bacterium]